jgi:hypothetical protein
VDPVPDPLLLRKSGSAGNRSYIAFLESGLYIILVKNSKFRVEAIIILEKIQQTK